MRKRNICSIEQCSRFCFASGMCELHYNRVKKTGSPYGLLRRPNGAGSIDAYGYRTIRINGGKARKTHLIAAEAALGKCLPQGAQVHHVDLNRANDENTNLVICPSQSYHKLLHTRTNALNACGNPDWRHCWICKQYAPVSKLRIRKTGNAYFHAQCQKVWDATYDAARSVSRNQYFKIRYQRHKQSKTEIK